MAKAFGAVAQFPGVSTPAGNPPAGSYLLYVKSADGRVYVKNSAGVESLAVPGGEPVIVAGTTAQYWRGDKTWQTLNAAAVGAETAITAGTTAQYWRGDKSWQALTPAAVGAETAITAGTAAQYWRGDKTWQALDVSAVANAMGLTTQQTVTGLKLFQARARVGFNAAVVQTPLTTSALELELSSQSMITLGESVAGDANPALTMYRTGAGARTGGALRQVLTASGGPFKWQWGSAAYGTETYSDLMSLDVTGQLSVITLNPTNALAQAKTHASPDTDVATTSLHHTLGTGANQAAAGNHLHTGVYEPFLAAGTTAQYHRGDKTWQTLDKTAVGLANVDNTSDVNKPVSTAVSTALGGKEPTVAAATGTPSLQYWRGDKTWQPLNLAALPDAWVKRSVRVASTTNVVIATGGLQIVDGVTTVAGDRVLLKNQTTVSENGIYQVNAGAWTRASDANTSAMMAGADVAVDSGTQGGFLYSNLFKTTDTLGTTAMNWYRVVDQSMVGAVGGVDAYIAPGTTTQYLRGDKTWQNLPVRDSGATSNDLYDATNVRRAVVDTFGFNVLSGGLFDNGSRVYSDSNPPQSLSWTITQAVSVTGTIPVGTARQFTQDGKGLWTKTSDGVTHKVGHITVKAATTANITLAAPQVIDGVSLAAGDYCLVKDQTAPSTNGVYIVGGVGVAWGRVAGFDTAQGVGESGLVTVQGGALWGGTMWETDFKATDTLDVNSTGTGSGMAWAMVNNPLFVKAAAATNFATFPPSGPQTVDGITCNVGDRVLVRMQGSGAGTTPTNGIYIVQTGAWTRSPDSDTIGKMLNQTVVVQQGAQFGGTTFRLVMQPTDVLGTTAVLYAANRPESVGYLVYPTPVGNGHTVYDYNRQMLATYDGGGSGVQPGWRYSGVAQVSATAPSFPVAGWQWYDTTAKVMKVYDGTTWQADDAASLLRRISQTPPVTPSGNVGGNTYGNAAGTIAEFSVDGRGLWTMGPDTQTFKVGQMIVKGVSTTNVATLSGQPTIDGYLVLVGDYVLLAGQTNAVDNGVYQINSGAWTRVPGFDGPAALSGSGIISVQMGATYGGTKWVQDGFQANMAFNTAKTFTQLATKDTGWVNLTMSSGATRPTGAIARIRQIGSIVYWEIGNCTLSAVANVSTNGGITDTPIASVPTTGSPIVTLPATNQRVAGFAGSRPAFFNMGPTGAIVLYAADGYGTATTITAGSNLQFSGSYFTP